MTDTPEQQDGGHVKPFAAWLQSQAGGSSHAELSESLTALVSAVKETGRAGTLTYQVKVSKLDKNAGDALVVADTITLKAPKPARPTSVFFSDADGNLQRNDPAQMTFDEGLRAAPTPASDEPLKHAVAAR